jgi:hypothetical protein
MAVLRKAIRPRKLLKDNPFKVRKIRVSGYPWDKRLSNYGYIVVDGSDTRVSKEIQPYMWMAVRDANTMFETANKANC